MISLAIGFKHISQLSTDHQVHATYQIWFLQEHNRKRKENCIQSCKYSGKPWLTYFPTAWNFKNFKLQKKAHKLGSSVMYFS